MPTAAGRRYVMPESAKPRRRARSADDRPARALPGVQSNICERKGELDGMRITKTASETTPDRPPPLYVVCEESAKRKYLAMLRHREQRSARRRIQDSVQSPPAVAGGSSTVDQGDGSPISSEGGAGSSRGVLDTDHVEPSANAPIGARPRFELEEMVVQLQAALATCRAENLRLRFGGEGGALAMPQERLSAETARQQLRSRTSRATQTVENRGEGSSICADATSSPRPMDRLDRLLDERRSKQLERVLLERTLRLTDVQSQFEQATEEAVRLRATSHDRDETTAELEREIEALKLQLSAADDRITCAERRAEAGERGIRAEASLRLELQQVRAQLTAKEAEATELHGLCDYLHAETAQLRVVLRVRDALDHELTARRRIQEAEQKDRQQTVAAFRLQRPVAAVPQDAETFADVRLADI